MIAGLAEAVELFYSYASSEQDESLRRQLDTHLKQLERSGLISSWHRKKVSPGADQEQETETHFRTAQIILLLVSPDFLASDYCYGTEMQQAMERHEAKEACVIPILLRPVYYKDAPFEKIEVLPSNGKPITSWSNLDEAFEDVARGISRAAQAFRPLASKLPMANSPLLHVAPVWMVPYRRNAYFTGREELLVHLRDSLTKTKAAALSQPQAINGLGGVGKTQTAVEYAYRYRKEYDHVFWIRAATSDTIVTDFVMIAELLHLPQREEQEQGKVIAAVKQWLATRTKWLLIFDNADDIELIRNFLPEGENGHIVLTTRSQAVGFIANSIGVEPMGQDEGTLLLLRRAKVLEVDETLDQATIQDRLAAETIVTLMGGLPLALDQAAAYIPTRCATSW